MLEAWTHLTVVSTSYIPGTGSWQSVQVANALCLRKTSRQARTSNIPALAHSGLSPGPDHVVRSLHRDPISQRFFSNLSPASRANWEMKADGMHFESVAVEGPDFAGVARLVLNRPKQSNALNAAMFREIPAAVASLDADPNVRVIIVAGSGKHFCAGIDLQFLSTDSVQSSSAGGGAGRLGLEREAFRRHVKWLQDAFTSFEHCRKPVIAAIHGACIGAGIDMITACDLRYCTDDAKFSVKEVDLAITADLGTLQRLPHVVGYSATMELALTARAFDGKEARELKLVHGVLPSKDLLDERVYAVAAEIAGKSPLAIMGTKAVLLKSRNSSVADGLDYVATWNAALLHKEDILESMMSRMEHRKPLFAKL